jgi:serine/threonine protein kinase
MPDPKPDDNCVDELAEEFAHRWRAGERPSVEEYVQRYPQWADEIRAVLPAVVMMEQLKPRREDAAPAAPALLSDQPPARIGEYRILCEIGRGGMGVVYEAEQGTLGRRVAIKVLPAHVLANETLRSRFHREAQAAARLHHTNIVPVFGVGECDGLCFYVMQRIDGCGLDQVIRQTAEGPNVAAPPRADTEGTIPWRQRQDAVADTAAEAPHPAGAPADPFPCSGLSGLTPREFFHTVARLGAQVADALAHAHSQGILHRDIKPSNLLLDDRGTVWVTDFGVAKLVEEANLTASGDLVGTLKYMPPERFAGVSDARGDVYSLGITLYELLTLHPAFPDATPQHLIHLITHESPTPPRKLNPQIPADLETIILKAAARDPSQRYQTPDELTADLRRFLADRPIRARRTGLAERFYRWCRRNPALAAATAAAFLLMIAITLVSMAAYAQTAAASRETAAALAAEKTQREHAENTSTMALDALNRIYDRFAPTRLVVTPQVSSDEGVDLPIQPALPPEAIRLLEDLLRTYERLARAGGEIPRLQFQAAEANYRIGDINQRLGQFPKAADAYRSAIDLYTRRTSTDAAATAPLKLARVYNELGRTLHSLQQFDEATRMHQQAIRTLTDVPEVLAKRPECRYELARSYCALGQHDMMLSPRGPGPKGPPPGKRGKGPRGDRPPPPDEHERGPGGEDHPSGRAVALLEELVREFPRVPEYRHLLACCYRDVPPERFGRRSEGPPRSPDRAVELLRQLVKDFPNVPDYRLDLCEALARPGPPPRGKGGSPGAKKRTRLEEAITLSGQLVVQYPNVPDYAAAHARYLDALGMSLYNADRLDESEQFLRRSVALQTKLVKQYPGVVAYTFWLGLMERSLGRTLGERGALKEARALIESGAGRVETLWKNDPRLGGARPFLGMAYRDLARVLTRSGEKALASQALRKADEFGQGPRKRPEEGRGKR